MITFKIESISPDKAIKWLTQNAVNRRLRSGKVQKLLNTIRSGKFRITHQGIAFDVDGKLIDGQHRLTAIARSGMTVECVVARYDISTTALAMPFDMNAVRSVTDVHGIDRRERELCGCMLRVVAAGSFSHVTYDDFVALNEFVGPYHRGLMDACPTTKKTRSSAAVRCAAVLNAVAVVAAFDSNKVEHVYEQYKAFVMQDFDAMWPSVKALFRWSNDTGAGGTGTTKVLHGWELTKDFLIRCVNAFNAKNKSNKTCRVYDQSAEYLALRKQILAMVNDNGIKLSFLTEGGSNE